VESIQKACGKYSEAWGKYIERPVESILREMWKVYSEAIEYRKN
jgi:hypothetical protein